MDAEANVKQGPVDEAGLARLNRELPFSRCPACGCPLRALKAEIVGFEMFVHLTPCQWCPLTITISQALRV